MSAAAPHGVKGIAFDWGGVFTVGTFDGRAIERLAHLLELPAAAVRGPYLDLMELFEVGAFDLPTFQARLCAALGREADEPPSGAPSSTPRSNAPRPTRSSPRSPTSTRSGMLSNNVPVLCDRVRDDARTARVERFVFSNEIGVRKPDPAAYMALAEALQLAPHEIVFVDDAERNVAAAQALGFRALLLDAPAAFAARWRAALPDLAHAVDGPGWSESDA